jgi:hypothetical protein
MPRELFDKYAKDRERARQADNERRDAERKAKESACAADNGHVYKTNGHCAGCGHYSQLHDKEGF